MSKQTKKIMIIGGGITGLSAAFYAQRQFAEEGLDVDITVVESSKNWGGKIQTLHRDGFVIERGPDSFLSRKLPILTLTKELGIEDQLVTLNPHGGQSYILLKGKLHPIPQGMVMGIPTRVAPFMKTGLISPLGKLRAAMDLIIPRRKDAGDESLGDFIERRLGKEVLEHVAEPLLAGIYAGDTHDLSLQATFPQFHGIEEKKRSVILGMTESRKATAASSQLPDIAKKSTFLSYKKGLSTLVDRLIEVLNGKVHLQNDRTATKIEKVESGYHIRFEDGEDVYVDGVIITTPAHITAQILDELPAAKELKKIPFVSVANVILAFDKKTTNFNIKGSGFVIPGHEGRKITACTWTSTKWLHTAPEDKILIRCYIGRAGQEELTFLPDEELLKIARQEIKELMGLTAEPLFYEINRWQKAMPQYPIGHLQLIKSVRQDLDKEMPGVFITGASYQGVGIPDCIQQGKDTAMQMASYLRD